MFVFKFILKPHEYLPCVHFRTTHGCYFFNLSSNVGRRYKRINDLYFLSNIELFFFQKNVMVDNPNKDDFAPFRNVETRRFFILLNQWESMTKDYAGVFNDFHIIYRNQILDWDLLHYGIWLLINKLFNQNSLCRLQDVPKLSMLILKIQNIS